MTTTNFVWDYVNDCYLAEVDDSGNATAVYTNEPVRYGSVISQNRGGTTSYNHYDAQGSTRQLTDQNAQVTDEYTYNAFGETVASSGTTSNPFRYVGEYGYYTDAETNEIYVRARTYTPSLARWGSRDPIGFDGSPWNLYEYVSATPLVKSDPSGVSGWIPFPSSGSNPCINPFTGRPCGASEEPIGPPDVIDCITECYDKIGAPLPVIVGALPGIRILKGVSLTEISHANPFVRICTRYGTKTISRTVRIGSRVFFPVFLFTGVWSTGAAVTCTVSCS